jgi:tubulin alpha
MREIICLHIGQGGIQLGGACWELFCLEHGIHPNGERTISTTSEQEEVKESVPKSAHLSPQCLFSQCESGKFHARAVLVDLDYEVIDDYKKSPFSELFHPDMFISAKENAADNFAIGYYTAGKKIMPFVLEQKA